MKCFYCNQIMAHANMSGTDHCLNEACPKPKEIPPLTYDERLAKLEDKVETLEELVDDLRTELRRVAHTAQRLADDHGRC
jgi:phage FluMu protein Com